MNKGNMMQTLSNINKKFLSIKSDLTKSDVIIGISECLDQNHICFSYNDVLNKSYSKFDTIPENKKGIYLFEGKYKTNSKVNWEHFKDKWKSVKYTPDIVGARFKTHGFSTDAYIPLYAGKASVCLKKRIVQHIFAQKKNQKDFLASTSTLRLLQHIQICEDIFNLDFKVKYAEISIEKELLPILETGIREHKKCMIGKNS